MKKCFLECVMEYAGLVNEDRTINRKSAIHHSKLFPNKYKKELLRAVFWCFEGKFPTTKQPCILFYNNVFRKNETNRRSM